MTKTDFLKLLAAYAIAYKRWYTAADYPAVVKAREKVMKAFNERVDGGES